MCSSLYCLLKGTAASQAIWVLTLSGCYSSPTSCRYRFIFISHLRPQLSFYKGWNGYLFENGTSWAKALIPEVPRFVSDLSTWLQRSWNQTQSSRLLFNDCRGCMLVVVACVFSGCPFTFEDPSSPADQLVSSICLPRSVELCTLTNYQSGRPSGSQLKF